MIYHALLVLLMLPLALLAQRFFRRSADTHSYLHQKANATTAAAVGSIQTAPDDQPSDGKDDDDQDTDDDREIPDGKIAESSDFGNYFVTELALLSVDGETNV